MAENVNRKILEAIKKSDCSDSIKDFLSKIILIELESSDKYKYKFADRYDPEIKKYSEKFNREKGVLTENSKVIECS